MQLTLYYIISCLTTNLICSIGVTSLVFQSSPLARDSSARRYRQDWSKFDQTPFLDSVDVILSKINVPFHLLQKSLQLPKNEVLICLDIYCAEICRALHFAKKQAVPMQRLFKGIVPGLLRSPELFTSCGQANFCFSTWKECRRPTTEHVNDIWISTRRKFSKILAHHRRDLVNIYSARAKQYSNMAAKLADIREAE